MQFKLKKETPLSSPPATPKTPQPPKRTFNFFYIDIIIALVVIAVLFSIPYVNLIAMPVILPVAALLLIYISWRYKNKT